MSLTRRRLGGLVLQGAVAAAFPYSTSRAVGMPPAAGTPSGHEFHFLDEAGAPRRLADIPAKAFLLNFWATWCPPCIAEMPSLDRLQHLLTGDAIKVLPLSADSGGRAEVARFYQRHGLRNLGIWLDREGEAARAYDVRSLPTSVLTDGAGGEIARVEGAAQWDAPQILVTIRRMVAGASMG